MKITAELRSLLIADAKAHEQKEDVVGLIGNLPSMRLVLNWPHIPLAVPDEFELPTNHNSTARKIWAGVEIELEEVALLARIPGPKVLEHLREAQTQLWIYPDGTTHKHALDLAKATIIHYARRKGS